MVELYRVDLLTDTKTCYRYLQVGLAVILLTFGVGVVAALAPELRSVYQVLVMPTLFVGLGVLLFGVGTHLHIMHINALRMMEEPDDDGESAHE